MKSFPWRAPHAARKLRYEVLTLDETPVAVVRRAGQTVETLRVLEPNQVHAAVYDARRNEWTDLGLSPNLRTTVGLDWEAAILGGAAGTTSGTPATNSGATSLTATGSPWTTGAWKGYRVYVDNGTGAPVYGNITANTANVLTVDQWWNANDTLGTTPGTTAAFGITPGQGSARFVGLTTSSTTPLASDTVLAAELATGGLGRALGTYAHTAGATYYTLSKIFTYTSSGSLTVNKAGTFTAASNGILVFETQLTTTATVSVPNDQITFTWTVNI